MDEDYLTIERLESIPPHPELNLDGYRITESYIAYCERNILETGLEAIIHLNPEGHGIAMFRRSDGAMYAGPLFVSKTDIEENRVPAPCDCDKREHWIKPNN